MFGGNRHFYKNEAAHLKYVHIMFDYQLPCLIIRLVF